MHTLLNGFAQGWLHLPVVARFPLAEAAKAHELWPAAAYKGKVLLAVNEDGGKPSTPGRGKPKGA